MAEFVSAVVGLIAVGAKIGDSLYTVIDTLKDAPNEFLALSDEVTDFRQVLAKVIEVRQSGRLGLGLNENKADDRMDVALKNGMNILQDIDALVRKVSCEQQDKERVNRLSWLRRAKRASKLQTALRVQKSSLSNAITIETFRICMFKYNPSPKSRIHLLKSRT
jgi:hypothetical protein